MIGLKLSGLLRKLWLKLMISYALATVLVLIVGNLVNGLIEYYRLHNALKSDELAGRMIETGQDIVPLLKPSSKDLRSLNWWLGNREEEIRRWQLELAPSLSNYLDRYDFKEQRHLLFITDQEGIILAGTRDTPELRSINMLNIRKLLIDNLHKMGHKIDSINGLSNRELLSIFCSVFNWGDYGSLILVPIKDNKQVFGTVVVEKIRTPKLNRPIITIWYDLLGDASVSILLVGLFGLLFGWLLGWHLTSRINRIVVAAQSWSSGEFSVLANDQSADELGQLAQRLNGMARQLRETFELREKLAASEERNRLARDLHDTVKQQVFALTMQLGAAQVQIEQNRSADQSLQTYLSTAEKLARQAQQDLVQIIRELKPATQPRQDLPVILQDYLTEWSRQNRISAEVECDDTLWLPWQVQITFLRIIQEACANIVRHSQAQQVTVTLKTSGNRELLLTIRDNGRGFNTQTVVPGMGLQNMRERVEALPGGWFKIISQMTTGTEIHAGCKLSL
ncbi:MAG: sensor histidine kinase [Acidobacteriota bacterium]